MKRIVAIVLIVAIIALVIFGCTYSPVDVKNFEYKPNQKTQYISSDGEPIGQSFNENRTYVKLEEMPQELIDGVIAVEDSRFYEHNGYDPIGIVRALFTNVKEGEIAEGASTITQQLARNLFDEITTEQTVKRKVDEVLVARQLERKYTKDQILEMYLNEIYLGSGTFGVQEASLEYFGKDVTELNLAECAMIVGLPKAPSAYAPDEHFDQAKERQEVVLDRMVTGGYITEEEAQTAKETKVDIATEQLEEDEKVSKEYRAFVNQVGTEYREILQDKYPDREISKEAADKSIQNDGLIIKTTVNSKMQSLALESLNEGIRTNGLEGLATGTMVTVDSTSGAVRAYYGGNTEIDMANKPRQPASAIKPLIYSKAIDDGILTGNSLIKDEPVSYSGGSGQESWTPGNVDGQYLGYMTVREAIVDSRNIPAIKTLDQLGVDSTLEYLKSLGITTIAVEDYGNLSVALGGLYQGITPLQMTRAYTAFSNEGVMNDTYFIESIEDSNGNVLYERQGGEGDSNQVMKPSTANEIKDILIDVVGRGTGTGARSSYVTGGKTGTGDDKKNLWFVGFTGNMTTSVWLGNVDTKPIPATSGDSARIYNDYVSKLISDNLINESSLERVTTYDDTTSILVMSPDVKYTPGQSISGDQVISIIVPKDQVSYFDSQRISSVSIDKDSGKLFVDGKCPPSNRITRYYLQGQEPTASCDLDHTWDNIQDFFDPFSNGTNELENPTDNPDSEPDTNGNNKPNNNSGGDSQDEDKKSGNSDDGESQNTDNTTTNQEKPKEKNTGGSPPESETNVQKLPTGE